jgi:hypothetical protein
MKNEELSRGPKGWHHTAAGIVRGMKNHHNSVSNDEARRADIS